MKLILLMLLFCNVAVFYADEAIILLLTFILSDVAAANDVATPKAAEFGVTYQTTFNSADDVTVSFAVVLDADESTHTIFFSVSIILLTLHYSQNGKSCFFFFPMIQIMLIYFRTNQPSVNYTVFSAVLHLMMLMRAQFFSLYRSTPNQKVDYCSCDQRSVSQEDQIIFMTHWRYPTNFRCCVTEVRSFQRQLETLEAAGR